MYMTGILVLIVILAICSKGLEMIVGGFKK